MLLLYSFLAARSPKNLTENIQVKKRRKSNLNLKALGYLKRFFCVVTCISFIYCHYEIEGNRTEWNPVKFGTRAIINKAGSLKLLLSGFLLLQTSQH